MTIDFKNTWSIPLPQYKYREDTAVPCAPSFTAFVPRLAWDGDYKVKLENYKDFYYSAHSLLRLNGSAFQEIEIGLVIKRPRGYVKSKNRRTHEGANWSWRLFTTQRHHNYTISWNHLYSDVRQSSIMRLVGNYNWKGDSTTYSGSGIFYQILDTDGQLYDGSDCIGEYIWDMFNLHNSGYYQTRFSIQAFPNYTPPTSTMTNKGPHCCMYYGIIFRCPIGKDSSGNTLYAYSGLSDNSIGMYGTGSAANIQLADGWNHLDKYKAEGKLY